HPDQNVSPLSIACAPNKDALLEFHLFHPAENTKAQDLMRMATQEKLWLIGGPFGRCKVSSLRRDIPTIFIASGTGLASIKAVVEELLRSHDYPPICLYWS